MATQMLKIENTQCNVSAVTPVSCSIGDEPLEFDFSEEEETEKATE